MICPEFFGCSGKLDFGEVQRLMFATGLTTAGDFSRVEHSDLILSIDRVSRCATDPLLFAEIAICHACRDIEAGLATPSQVLICYEFGIEDGAEERVAMSQAVVKAAANRAIRVGKAHSTSSEGATAFTIAAIGTGASALPPISSAGTVWLSHGIGAAKLQYLNEIAGHPKYLGPIDYLRSAVSTQQFSHCAYGMSDVSGYGLAGCLLDLALRFNIAIDVQCSQSLALHPDVCVVSVTDFENELSSYGEAAKLSVAPEARSLSLLRETSGPIVALSGLDDSSRNAFEAANWMALGTFAAGDGGVSIKWKD